MRFFNILIAALLLPFVNKRKEGFHHLFQRLWCVS